MKVSCFLVAAIVGNGVPPGLGAFPTTRHDDRAGCDRLNWRGYNFKCTIANTTNRLRLFHAGGGKHSPHCEWGKAVLRTRRVLIHGGMEWADCGPLASYRWIYFISKFRYNALHLVVKAGTEKIKERQCLSFLRRCGFGKNHRQFSP